jgi:RNA polymerase subunit RPABC4/transcription elongation factor Spt4
MEKVVKISELDGKSLVDRETIKSLRGRFFILKPEESEIAKNLEIKEKGVFGARFR